MAKGYFNRSEEHSLNARGQKTSIETKLNNSYNKLKSIKQKREQLLKDYIVDNVSWIMPDMVTIQLRDDGEFGVEISKPESEAFFIINIPDEHWPNLDEIITNTDEEDINEYAHELIGDSVDQFLHKKIGNKTFNKLFIKGNKDMYGYMEEHFNKEFDKIKNDMCRKAEEEYIINPSDDAMSYYGEVFHDTLQDFSEFKYLEVYSDGMSWDEHKGYKSVYINRIESTVNAVTIKEMVKELKTIKPML